jgi:hypothetical protein
VGSLRAYSTVGGLFVLACGHSPVASAPPRPSTVLPAPRAEATSTPTASPPAKPDTPGKPSLMYADALKREAKELRISYALTVTEGITVNVESTTKPELKVQKNALGQEYSSFSITLDREAEVMGCVYNPNLIDLGSLVEMTSKNSADIRLRGSEFSLDVAGRIAIPKWTVFYEMGNVLLPKMGAFSVSAFYMSKGTMICTFDSPGFRTSVDTIMRGIAKSAVPDPLSDYQHIEVVTIARGDTPLGLAQRLYKRTPQGYAKTTLAAMFYIDTAGKQFRSDVGTYSEIDREGRLLSSKKAAGVSGEKDYERVLERSGEGLYKYSITRGTTAEKGTVRGTVTSSLVDAQERRRMLRTPKYEANTTTFFDTPPRIERIHVTRHTSKVLLLDDGDGQVGTCTMDANGECETYVVGTQTTRRVFAQGDYPKLDSK